MIPFVRGAVAYGDPLIIAIRQGPERWLYATDAPPLVGTAGAYFIGLREPLGLDIDSIEIVFYRRRSRPAPRGHRAGPRRGTTPRPACDPPPRSVVIRQNPRRRAATPQG
jgi:hypothetical protein